MRRGAKQATSQLRVIGGQWRGRKLPFPDRPGLRPTGDRVRETLLTGWDPVFRLQSVSTCLPVRARWV